MCASSAILSSNFLLCVILYHILSQKSYEHGMNSIRIYGDNMIKYAAPFIPPLTEWACPAPKFCKQSLLHCHSIEKQSIFCLIHAGQRQYASCEMHAYHIGPRHNILADKHHRCGTFEMIDIRHYLRHLFERAINFGRGSSDCVINQRLKSSCGFSLMNSFIKLYPPSVIAKSISSIFQSHRASASDAACWYM